MCTYVIVENQRKDMVVAEQLWCRSLKDSDGWFTLRNRASGKFLTAAGPEALEIQGTIIIN